MLTLEIVREQIDLAEATFAAISGKLLGAQAKPDHIEDPTWLLSCQGELAETFWRLTGVFRRAAQERKNLIANRAKYSAKWFRSRTAALKTYKSMLLRAISIGRLVGDGFAWIFYHDEQKLLNEHLQKPLVTISPPGLGGAGELQFVKNVRVVGGYFLLYHGITSFLRVGDFSLIDIPNHRVACLGELKTTPAGRNHLTLNLTVAGSKTDLSMMAEGFSGRADATTTPESLSPFQKDRLEKQVLEMFSSIEKGPPPDANLQSTARAAFDALGLLHSASTDSGFVFKPADPGRFFVGYRDTKPTLSMRLSHKRKGFPQKELNGILPFLKPILIEGRADNNLVLTNLVFDERGGIKLVPGTVPFLWWPLPPALIEDVAFQRFNVIGVLNTAHIAFQLERHGFAIASAQNRVVEVKKEVEGRAFVIGDLNHLFDLVLEGLFEVESVAMVLDAVCAEAAKAPPNMYGQIRLDIRQRFGVPLLVEDSI